jgi:hypothetical protein
MFKLRRGAGIAGALALTVAGIAVPAQAAQAAGVEAVGDCPSSYACLWTLTNYTGTRWQGMNPNPTVSAALNDNSWSAYNNGVNCTVHWYTGTSYTGSRLDMARGTGLPDLGSWRDVISSMNWC